jgi:carboxylate-amine ligase
MCTRWEGRVNLAELDRAAEVFAASEDLTVGIEEEFAVLDPVTLDLAPRFGALRDRAKLSDPVLHEHITGELIASEIEIISGRGDDIHDALRRQGDRRRRLFAHARANDTALGATGTHPWADYRRQPIIDTEHYRRVEEGLQYVAWRNNTFSLHVHVGVRDADRAVRICDRLRPVLPLLLAVSANSPYVDGRSAGLHSARSQIFTRNFPRCGVPDVFGGWQAYRDYVAFLIETRSIVEFTQVWWSIRPHFSFGTVEVRICDAQSTAGEADALTELIVACVAQAGRDIDEGVPHTDEPARLIEENMWRAIRYGLDGRMIDLRRADEYPAAEIGDRLLEWTAPVRAELGIEPALAAANGAQRQRRMIETGASMEDVYASVVRETRATYSEEVPA